MFINLFVKKTVFWFYDQLKWFYIKMVRAHTHTHARERTHTQNIYTVNSSTNVTTINISNNLNLKTCECFINTSQQYGCSPVCSLMYLQIVCFTECFITQITAILTLPSMYTLMYLQIICFSKCIIKHNTLYVHCTVCILR